MKEKIIDAEAVNTLAGLQIDQLQKFRSGQLTFEHMRWFLGLTKKERDELLGLDNKFEAMDTIAFSVPEMYCHETQIRRFLQDNANDISFVAEHFTDYNFSFVSDRLVPGKSYAATLYRIKRSVSSEECLQFMLSKKAVFAGAQILTLLWELDKPFFPQPKERGYLPRPEYLVLSYDAQDGLWTNGDGKFHIPAISRQFSGKAILSTVDLATRRDPGSLLLVLNE